MNKGQKVALRHAANAIDGTRPVGGATLGASPYTSSTASDRHGRPFASTYLARRAGYTPASQTSAQQLVTDHYGLSDAQVTKLDRVAASTHNLKQRSQRVAAFLRRIAEDPSYTGLTRTATTGAVGATL